MTRIFISYSRHDSHHADRWYNALSKSHHDVWMDRVELRAGAEWRREIEEYIQWSEAMVVMWSHNAQNSKWVRREVELADSLDKVIIPLQIDNISPAPDIIINSRQIIDARNLTIEQILKEIESAFETNGNGSEPRPLYHRQPAATQPRRWVFGAGALVVLAIVLAGAFILPDLVAPQVTSTATSQITLTSPPAVTPATLTPDLLSRPVTLETLNQWRTGQNMPPLEPDDALMNVAEDHERYLRGLPLSELESTNIFRNAEGRDALFMAGEAGYTGDVRMIVEVADTALTLQQLVESLESSDADYTNVGLGRGQSMLTGKQYFVLILGK